MHIPFLSKYRSKRVEHEAWRGQRDDGKLLAWTLEKNRYPTSFYCNEQVLRQEGTRELANVSSEQKMLGSLLLKGSLAGIAYSNKITH